MRSFFTKYTTPMNYQQSASNAGRQERVVGGDEGVGRYPITTRWEPLEQSQSVEGMWMRLVVTLEVSWRKSILAYQSNSAAALEKM
jgi:hypothetical protein